MNKKVISSKEFIIEIVVLASDSDEVKFQQRNLPHLYISKGGEEARFFNLNVNVEVEINEMYKQNIKAPLIYPIKNLFIYRQEAKENFGKESKKKKKN